MTSPRHSSSQAFRRHFDALLLFTVAAHLSSLGIWFVLLRLIGDATAYLFVVNSLALYLFTPLPFALAAALYLRRLSLIGGTGVGAVLFVFLWGGLFLPHRGASVAGPTLTVMTYNVLGYNKDPAGVVEAMRASGADIIGISELNSAVAAAIEDNLIAEYPYQVLDGRDGVRGSGIVSRIPIQPLDVALDDPAWISAPTAVEFQWGGKSAVFLRVHSTSGVSRYEARERQARLISGFATKETRPLIVAGDFNASALNDSYGTLTEHLTDVWREAGRGFGNTFPGASKSVTPGSSRPMPLGIDLPKWLIRIDYIFVSDEWRAAKARIGPWDGNSDHRPVLAELTLR